MKPTFIKCRQPKPGIAWHHDGRGTCARVVANCQRTVGSAEVLRTEALDCAAQFCSPISRRLLFSNGSGRRERHGDARGSLEDHTGKFEVAEYRRACSGPDDDRISHCRTLRKSQLGSRLSLEFRKELSFAESARECDRTIPEFLQLGFGTIWCCSQMFLSKPLGQARHLFRCQGRSRSQRRLDQHVEASSFPRVLWPELRWHAEPRSQVLAEPELQGATEEEPSRAGQGQSTSQQRSQDVKRVALYSRSRCRVCLCRALPSSWLAALRLGRRFELREVESRRQRRRRGPGEATRCGKGGFALVFASPGDSGRQDGV